MKRVLSMILALLMIVGTMVVMPLTATAADAEGWDGKATKPAGTGRENDPYIIDEPGDLNWFQGVYSNAQLVSTLGWDGKIYAAQYENFDMSTFNNSTFEAGVTDKSIDYTKPMVEMIGTTINTAKTWEWGTKIYIKQVCDIDLNGQTLRPMCYYWRYSDGSAQVKGNFFCGEYDGQGYTIKNGTVKQNSTNAAWTSGLFGVLWGATIKNIVFEDFHAVGNANTSGIGIIASRTLGVPDLVERNNHDATPAVAAKVGKSVVENIKVLDSCTVVSKQGHDAGQYSRGDWRYCGTGGIVGAVSNADIKSCAFMGTVYPTVNDVMVGGVVGGAGFGAVVDGCYFGGTISYEKNTSAALAAETHIGGVVGSWRGTNGACGTSTAASQGAIKGTNISNNTTSRGVNAITNCINNGSMNLKATVDEVATTVTNTVCNGGVLGATAQLFRGASGSYTFSGNVNLTGTAGIPSMTRTGGVAGCFYNSMITDPADAGKNGNTSTVDANMQKVVVSDCHSVATSVKSPNSSYPSTAKKLVGAVRNAACYEDDECTNLEGTAHLAGFDTIAEAFYKIDNGYFQGEGTEENPWKIGSMDDWNFFKLQMTGNMEFSRNLAFEGKYLVQTADLDFEGAKHSPLGRYQPEDWHYNDTASSGKYKGYICINTVNDKGNSFRGSYDGQGYAFKNMVIDCVEGSDTNLNWASGGIFGSIMGATLKNIVLDNVTTTDADGQSGLLVGMSKAYRYNYDADAYKQYEGVRTTTVTVTQGSAADKFNRTTVAIDTWTEDGVEKSVTVTNKSETDVTGLTIGTTTTTAKILRGNADFGGIRSNANIPADYNVIENITVKNNCSMTITDLGAGSNFFGGIIGRAMATTIRNCYSGATINTAINTAIYEGVGGIVGVMSVATHIENCIGNATINFNMTDTTNTGENPFGGIVGAYDGVTTNVTTAQKLIKNCVNVGSFHAIYNGSYTYPVITIYYGGIVGGANNIPDTIGGHRIEKCYNLSSDITKNFAGTGDNKNASNKANSAKWRIGGMVGCYWVAATPATKDVLEIVNCSTVDLSAINTNGYWATYDGVICAYNRTVNDTLGAGKAGVCCISVTNTDGSAMQAKTAAQSTVLQTLAKSAVANVIKAKEALHFYGHQFKQENGSRHIRFLYDFAGLAVNGFKAKEVRFNVTVIGEGLNATKTVVQNTVYTSFLNHEDGGATTLTPSAGMTYMTGLTIKDLPSVGNYTVYVDAMLVGQNADRVETCVRRDFGVTMTISDGTIDVK